MKFGIENELEILITKINSWYVMFLGIIPNLILSILVFLVFLFFGSMMKRIMKKFVFLFKNKKSIYVLLENTFYFLILFLGLFVSFTILGLDKTVTSLLAGVGVFGIALGFALQDIASNFISGVLITIREPYKIGDVIKTEKCFGEVSEVNFRITKITTFQGLEMFIPNKIMFSAALTNYTTISKRRIDLTVGVSYADDLEKVELITKKALEPLKDKNLGKEIDVFFTEFDASSINLIVMLWIPQGTSFLSIRHQMIMNIKKAYHENNITIPFPIRTIDFDIKGGKDLSECLEKK